MRTFSILPLLLITFLVAPMFAVPPASTPPNQPIRVTPQSVDVHLGATMLEGKRQIFLFISTIAGGGCDKVSPMEVRLNFNSNVLTAALGGYDLYKVEPSATRQCPAAVVESHARIPIDFTWMEKSKPLTILLFLGNKENRFAVRFDHYRLRLSAVTLTNAKLVEGGPGTEKGILATPADVALIYPSGSVNKDVDWQKVLRRFIKGRGLQPAEKFYKGFPQDRKEGLYVALRAWPVPSQGESFTLGTLADPPGVKINLSAPPTEE